jgi:hypothetical protein
MPLTRETTALCIVSRHQQARDGTIPGFPLHPQVM